MFFFFYLKERESRMHCHLPAMVFKVWISSFNWIIGLVGLIFILKKFKTA